jgi:SHS2 domain-containing protein
MAGKNYSFISHTADIGIIVKGKNLEELFINAAQAMFEIIAEHASTTYKPSGRKFTIRQTAASVEELFVNWLNELLSLSAATLTIFCAFTFKLLDTQSLRAVVQGCDAKSYTIKTEVKAATRHELEVKRIKTGWQAKVIFDV